MDIWLGLQVTILSPLNLIALILPYWYVGTGVTIKENEIKPETRYFGCRLKIALVVK